MYQEHECFTKPDKLQAKIWRYSTLGKFIWSLGKSSLWFSRADLLGDPFEASWLPYIPPETRKGPVSEVFKDNYRRCRPFELDTTGVNCWHLNEHESAAMWELYCKGDEGVAIQSTFVRLTQSLKGCSHFASVGLVHYIDYTSESFLGQHMNGFQPFLHKRKSYEHEKEVRAIIWPPGGIPHDTTPIVIGLPVHVPIDLLIERIYVAPTAPPWVLEVVTAVCQRFGVNCDIVQSDLQSRPLY